MVRGNSWVKTDQSRSIMGDKMETYYIKKEDCRDIGWAYEN